MHTDCSLAENPPTAPVGSALTTAAHKNDLENWRLPAPCFKRLDGAPAFHCGRSAVSQQVLRSLLQPVASLWRRGTARPRRSPNGTQPHAHIARATTLPSRRLAARRTLLRQHVPRPPKDGGLGTLRASTGEGTGVP
eukprot:363618-Chlamydomonas_euryale.AAC.14